MVLYAPAYNEMLRGKKQIREYFSYNLYYGSYQYTSNGHFPVAQKYRITWNHKPYHYPAVQKKLINQWAELS